jgi:hypothetical protein
LALEVVKKHVPDGDANMQEAAVARCKAECAAVEQQFATATAAIKSLEVHQPSPLEVEQEACVKKCTEAKATADASVTRAVARLHAAEEQTSGSDSDEELCEANTRNIANFGNIVAKRRAAADAAVAELEQSKKNLGETIRKREQALGGQVESARKQKERTMDAIEARYIRLKDEIEMLWNSGEGGLALQSAAPGSPRFEEQTSGAAAADDSNAPSSPGLFAKPGDVLLDCDSDATASCE